MARFYDTLLGEYIKNPGVRGLSLDKLALRYFDYEMISFDNIVKKQKLKNFAEVDLKLASEYSGEDVYITSLVYNKQKKELENQNKTSSSKGGLEGGILENIEFPLIEVLKDMELTGVKIDRDKLKGIGLLLNTEISFLEKRIYEQAGEEFNIKSPKQVGEILFGKLALPKGKKTKTGWSVSADVLGDLSHDYPIAQDIVDYRHYTKIKSTYIEGLLDIADENDLVHTSYNQTVTSTGRLSSTKPNLQNIPSSSGIAGEVRDAFISRFESGKIMAADYSQVEVRLLAIMSGDENLINAFKNGLDIHHKTAEFIFGTNTISSSQRKIAKAVNFGVIYGISGFGLSKMLGISVKDANQYIKKFYENYPKVRTYLDETIAFCEKNGYVETLFGRRRYIGGINDRNGIIRSSAQREAINMPIQGTSADIIKLAMIKVADFLDSPIQTSPFTGERLKSKMIMQVHDELVFDVYPGEEEILEKNVKEIMQTVLKDQTLELKVDIEIGNSWRDAK